MFSFPLYKHVFQYLLSYTDFSGCRNFDDAEEILTAALKKAEERFGLLHQFIIAWITKSFVFLLVFILFMQVIIIQS